MLNGLFSFLGGIGDFTSYIVNYFKNRGIVNTQKDLDTLSEGIRDAKVKLDEHIKICEKEKALIRIEYEQKLDEIIAKIDSTHPRVGGREISG